MKFIALFVKWTDFIISWSSSFELLCHLSKILCDVVLPPVSMSTTVSSHDFFFSKIFAGFLIFPCILQSRQSHFPLFNRYSYISWAQTAYVLVSKGKGIPLQAGCGPEGSRRFRLPDFMTFGTWRWRGCQPHAPAAFTPRKFSWYSYSRGTDSTVGRNMSLKNPVIPPEIDPGTVRLVAQRLNHYATPVPMSLSVLERIGPDTALCHTGRLMWVSC